MSTPTRLDINEPALSIECTKWNVFLDGRQVHNCEVADSEAGYIVQRRKHPLFGTLLKDRRGKYMTRKLEGVVTFERK